MDKQRDTRDTWRRIQNGINEESDRKGVGREKEARLCTSDRDKDGDKRKERERDRGLETWIYRAVLSSL